GRLMWGYPLNPRKRTLLGAVCPLWLRSRSKCIIFEVGHRGHPIQFWKACHGALSRSGISEAFRLQQRFLLDEFAFHGETALGGTIGQQMKSSAAFELLQLPRAANDLPHSIVQELRLAVRPGDEYRLDNPFDVGLVAIRRSEFQITARLTADTRHDV